MAGLTSRKIFCYIFLFYIFAGDGFKQHLDYGLLAIYFQSSKLGPVISLKYHFYIQHAFGLAKTPSQLDYVDQGRRYSFFTLFI